MEPTGTDASNQTMSLTELNARCTALQARIVQLDKINAALMDRVERDMDAQGSAFSLFEAAIALESQVKERTAALQQALHRLETTNRELVASNEAAQQASRAKSAFLAAMSHELRTPMNGVVGMTEILLNTPLNDAQQRSANNIRQSALALLRILNDILDFSKIEAGQMQTEEIAFDLRHTFDNSLAVLLPLIHRKGLALNIDWPVTLPTAVCGDPGRLAQIFTNLISNAIKFTAVGSIDLQAQLLSVSDTTLSYRFTVTDSGIGIRTAVIPQLFSSFTQADSSTTREYGGTGLGLAIVRRLCLLMGGDCGVQSQFGRGSSFWFTLPFKRDPQHIEQSPSPVYLPPTWPRSSRTQQPRLLLVEDNFINQEVVVALLELLHCQCTVAGNGQLAVQLLRTTTHFDLVLMDCQMPVMDGFEATRQIRVSETGSARHIPIVALTANAMVGDREVCLACGMDDFLSKPFQLEELAAMLRKWLPATAVLPGSSETGETALEYTEPQLDAQQITLLQSLREGALLPELLRSYCDQWPTQFSTLTSAASCGDTATLQSAAHSLKSASFSIGASRIGEVCARLEATARSGDMSTATELCEELAQHFAALRLEIEQR